jgi:hypothetical protein
MKLTWERGWWKTPHLIREPVKTLHQYLETTTLFDETNRASLKSKPVKAMSFAPMIKEEGLQVLPTRKST